MTSHNDMDNSWQSILILTDTMQTAAKEENWPVVASTAAQRHQQVGEHFCLFPVGPETAGYYAHRLNAFLANEQALQKLAKSARKKVMQLGTGLKRGRNISRIYQDSAKISG